MIVFDQKVEQVIDRELAKQVVLADADGFVMDNAGYVFDPDELVALFLSTQRQMQESVVRCDFGAIAEFSICVTGTELTIACRRVFWPGGGCLAIAVVEVGKAFNLIISDVIEAFTKYLDHQRAALRKTEPSPQ